jgi:hypothetical protein
MAYLWHDHANQQLRNHVPIDWARVTSMCLWTAVSWIIAICAVYGAITIIRRFIEAYR